MTVPRVCPRVPPTHNKPNQTTAYLFVLFPVTVGDGRKGFRRPIRVPGNKSPNELRWAPRRRQHSSEGLHNLALQHFERAPEPRLLPVYQLRGCCRPKLRSDIRSQHASVTRLFRQTPAHLRSFRLIPQPALDLDLSREPERGQERFIKRPHLSEVAHPKINVIKTAAHPWNKDSDRSSPAGGAQQTQSRACLSSTVARRMVNAH